MFHPLITDASDVKFGLIRCVAEVGAEYGSALSPKAMTASSNPFARSQSSTLVGAVTRESEREVGVQGEETALIGETTGGTLLLEGLRTHFEI
jgi:hypothetical protein